MARTRAPRAHHAHTLDRAKNDMGIGTRVVPCQRCERPGVIAFVLDRGTPRPVLACETCFIPWRQALRNDGADLVRPGCA